MRFIANKNGLRSSLAAISWAFLLVVILIYSCRKPERNNPWDEKNTQSPQEWAPKNLQIITLSPLARELSWEFMTPGIEGFKIDRKKGEEPWQEAYAIIPITARNWIDDQIVPDPALIYQYRVYAYAGGNVSAKTTITESAAIPAPTGLTVSKLTDISYQLEWTDNSTGEQGFCIDRKIDDRDWTIAYARVPEDVVLFEDPDIFPRKSPVNIQYRVYAYYDGYTSGYAWDQTLASLGVPASLEIIRLSVNSVIIQWIDTGTGEEGFVLERRTGNHDWSVISIQAEEEYTDSDFEFDTEVFYRVCAYKGAFKSDYTESSFHSVVPPPHNLSYLQNSITSITIGWEYTVSGHDGFRLERRKDAGNWELIVQAGASENTYTDNSIDLFAHDYEYRIMAFYLGYSSTESVLPVDSVYYIEPGFNTNLVMMKIKGGAFIMGSTGGNSNEQPVHSVTLNSYFMGAFEVTQAQWLAVMGENPSYFSGCLDCPVDFVTWNEIQTFVQNLSLASGKVYRLPTEAEWEYACGGGAQASGSAERTLWAGTSIENQLQNYAWFYDNSGGKSHAVGGKLPNRLGIYDMSGNIAEWCSDWYGPYNSGSQTNPQGPPTGNARVIRGSSWAFLPDHCRTASRAYEYPGTKSNTVGFRVVCSE